MAVSIPTMPGEGTTPSTSGATSTPSSSVLNYFPNPMPQMGAMPKPTIPSTITQTAAQAPKPAVPSYSGPHINSVPHVAQSLGAQYEYNPVTGAVLVNKAPVRPTSVINGVPHAPVHAVAQAAGIPPSNVQTNGNTTSVMPAVHPNAVPSASAQQGTLNPYWQDVANRGGLWMSGMTKQQIASKYGVDPSQIQMQSNGHAYIPFNAIANWAYAQSKPAPQPQQPSQTPQPSVPGIVDTPPQAPQLPQIPAFDASSIQPFQFDANQEFMNQYNAQAPGFQQQLAQSAQTINDQMNRRGIYTSGIAQQAVNTQAQALYGKLFDAIQKNSLADEKQAFQEYQTNITNHLTAYKDNVDAMYKAGQLTNQQYADAINIWKQQVSYAQDVYNQAQAMQRALIPYTMGPTPYQQQQLSLDQLKALLPYQMPTAYQQGQLNIDQQRLQAQTQQWQAQDQMRQEQIMGYDAQGNPTLARQKFDEQQQMDSAKIAEIQNKAQSTAYHDQAVNVGRELGSIDSQIKAVLASTMDANTRQTQLTQLYSQRDSLFSQLDTINLSLGGSTSTNFGNSTISPN